MLQWLALGDNMQWLALGDSMQDGRTRCPRHNLPSLLHTECQKNINTQFRAEYESREMFTDALRHYEHRMLLQYQCAGPQSADRHC